MIRTYRDRPSRCATCSCVISRSRWACWFRTSTSSRSQFSAEQICKSSDAKSVRTDAYQTYTESIAPGAFSAYERCLNSKLNLTFGEATVTKQEAIVTASYIPYRTGEAAKLTAFGQGGAECSWYSNTTDQNLVGGSLLMDRPRTAKLKCTRKDPSLQSFVHIFDENVGTAEDTSISLPWAPFKEGMPLSSYERLEERLALMEAALQASVLAVRSENCPRGFAHWDAAKGRFLRGVDPTGTFDADGVRTVGSPQGSAVESHTHQVVSPANRSGNPDAAMHNTPASEANESRRNYWRGNRRGVVNAETAANAGKETRPVNVAVNFCIKD